MLVETINNKQRSVENVKVNRVIILGVCAVVGAVTLARADETPAPAVAPAPVKSWSVDAGADYFSEYVFRGVDLLNHNPVAEPHVFFKWNNFGVYYTGYYAERYEEQDFSGDYTVNFFKDQLSLTGGAYGYTYANSNDGKNTVELYGVLAWNWSLLNPKLLINWDVDAFHAGYGQASISHAFDVSKTLGLKDPLALTITPSAALGIDFGYNDPEKKTNWNDVLLGLTANLQINKYLSAHAGVQFSVAMNSLNNLQQHNEAIANVGFNIVF